MKGSILLFLLVFGCTVNATEQIPEEFNVDGAKFEIDERPLESFISNEDFHKKINPSMCSASWRGYKGYWALRNKKLVLDVLVKNACSNKFNPIEANELFKDSHYPLIATWFTGKINVRIGERKFFDTKATGLSGVQFEAVVYEFQSGELASRSIEIVEVRW